MLSIIIPTLNEAPNLERTLAMVRERAGKSSIEVIVSDCNSADGTAELAGRLGAIVRQGSGSRSQALNHGAGAAQGEALLFLHADSTPPMDYPRLIERALSNPDIVGGAFEFKFAPHPLNHGLNKRLLQIVTVANRVRCRLNGRYFGDQGIFARRDIFNRLGGFPATSLLEDLHFCRRMNQLGKTTVLQPPIRTSPRRFVNRGVAQQFCIVFWLLTCDGLGVCPRKLWDRYNLINRSPQ